MTRISKKNFEALVIAPSAEGKNRLRDVHNYDILTNPAYSDRFLYIPCSYPDRHDYTISEYKDNYLKCYSTDIVRLVVDLAYMPVSEGKKLKFNEEFIFKHMIECRNAENIRNGRDAQKQIDQDEDVPDSSR